MMPAVFMHHESGRVTCEYALSPGPIDETLPIREVHIGHHQHRDGRVVTTHDGLCERRDIDGGSGASSSGSLRCRTT